MPFSFPSSPTNGQQSTQNGRLYQWTGTAWELVATPSGIDGAAITTGTVAAARLGSGTASSSTFLRGDNTWASAGSTSASDLTSGTLSDQRLSDKALEAINLYLWSTFR